MARKQRRERGSTLEPEQQTYIEEKFRQEGLSIKAAAKKYGIAEGTLRNALNGKYQDFATLEEIIDCLGVPGVKQLTEQRFRLFNIERQERNVYFTGRDNTMNALRQALERSRFATMTQSLSGLGGMGKTSTALEYAYRCLDRADYPDYPRYKAIQFARADTVEVLKYGYADIANALQLPRADPQNLDEAVQAVLRWMMQPEEAPWLLILDNADDLTILDGFLPKEPQRHFGHVLITSRSYRFTGRMERVEIEALAEEEGVTFLYRRTKRERIAGSKEEQAAFALAAEMGGLPLALEQVAAYLTQVEMMPFEDYLAQFRDQKARSDLMMYAPEYGFYRQFQSQTRAYTETLTVLTSWQMSLASLERDHPEAVDLLRLCAFLHPVGIPRELVIALLPDYFSPAGEDTLQQNALYNRLLNVLAGYSLIQRDLNDATHNIHILVQTVLRDSMPPDEQKQACEQLIAAIASTFPSDDWGLGGRGELYYPHAERLCDYAEQVNMEDEEVVPLLNQTGTFLYERGLFAKATPFFQQALARRQKALPEGHPDIAVSLNDLALLYQIQERFAEAELLYHQALAMKRKAFPEGHPETAVSLNCLAVFLQSQRRFTEAEPLHYEALAIRRQVFPEGHHMIGNSVGNLAILYQEQGRFAEAEPLFEQALQIVQMALPEGHPQAACYINNLARLYLDQGRFADAEPLLKQALAIRRQVLPEGHPHLIITLKNLIRLYRSQKRYVEAEPLMQHVLTMRRKTLPVGHPDIPASLSDLAKLYQEQGRFAEAIPLYQEALALLLSTHGIQHDDYQAVLTNYQSCVAQMKKDEAV